MKKIYLVCGMHRSGTSIITKFLEIFDINIGTDFAPTRKDNKTGFYEDMSFFFINRNLLRANRIEWDTLIDTTKNFIKERNIKNDNSINQLKQKIYFNHNFALKDPRSVLFLGIWKNFFKKEKIIYIYCFRHPHNIAKSIMKRDKKSRKVSLLLILQYWYLMLKNIKSLNKTIFIDYDLLLTNEKKVLTYLKKKLNKKINLERYNFIKKNIFASKNKKISKKESYDSELDKLLIEIYHFFKNSKGKNFKQLLKKIEFFYKNKVTNINNLNNY